MKDEGLRVKAIKGLECCILRDPDDHARCSQCPYESNCVNRLKMDALELLKEQENCVSIPFSWLVKFCTHIDFREPMSDEERAERWKEKLSQQFGVKFDEAD